MGPRRELPGSVKDDRLVSVAENALIQMPAHRAGKNNALEIAPAGDKILNLVAMRDARHVLLDNGPVVEQISIT